MWDFRGNGGYRWRDSGVRIAGGDFGSEYSEESDYFPEGSLHSISVCKNRPNEPRADSGARRVGGAVRPRNCRALRADLAWGADFARLAATVEAIRASILHPSPAVSSQPPTPAPSPPSVPATKPPYAPSSSAAPDPRPPSQTPLSGPSAVALPAAPAGFACLIVADFPTLFAEFRGKRLALLWRGSRDGFGAGDFYGRCDGHAPTLARIRDTKGNSFGASPQWSGTQAAGTSPIRV
jgi:hypothetical protein